MAKFRIPRGGLHTDGVDWPETEELIVTDNHWVQALRDAGAQELEDTFDPVKAEQDATRRREAAEAGEPLTAENWEERAQARTAPHGTEPAITRAPTPGEIAGSPEHRAAATDTEHAAEIRRMTIGGVDAGSETAKSAMADDPANATVVPTGAERRAYRLKEGPGGAPLAPGDDVSATPVQRGNPLLGEEAPETPAPPPPPPKSGEAPPPAKPSKPHTPPPAPPPAKKPTDKP